MNLVAVFAGVNCIAFGIYLITQSSSIAAMPIMLGICCLVAAFIPTATPKKWRVRQ